MTNPQLFAVPPIVFALVYAIRRWLPALWLPLTRWPREAPASNLLQALPSVLLGGLVAGMATGSPREAMIGALLSALAPLGHHLLKAAPVPYQGPLRDSAWQVAERARLWGEAVDRESRRTP